MHSVGKFYLSSPYFLKTTKTKINNPPTKIQQLAKQLIAIPLMVCRKYMGFLPQLLKINCSQSIHPNAWHSLAHTHAHSYIYSLSYLVPGIKTPL